MVDSVICLPDNLTCPIHFLLFNGADPAGLVSTGEGSRAEMSGQFILIRTGLHSVEINYQQIELIQCLPL